jgi:cytochrome c-type biogenesis protein CcmH/NrfG
VYLQDGQHQNAVVILRDLLRTDPNNSTMWNNLGNALIAMNQYDESVTALETAVRIDPKNKQAWANLGTVYQKGGYPDRAAAAFANAGTAR